MSEPIFHPTSEAAITRAMIRHHWKKFDEFAQSDVIIVGAGPAGLVAAYELGKHGVKTVIVERNNYLGGGMFLGGYGCPEMVIRAPGNFILQELDVPHEEIEPGLYMVNAPLVAGKIIAAAAESGAFIANLTSFEDVVLNDDREVAGIVMNWSPVEALPRQITCVDPIAIESKVVIGTTGHDDASVAARMGKLGLIEPMRGMGAMNVRLSEDEIIHHTKEVYPGLVLAGMEVAAHFGTHRMGPTFGAMFLSGKRAAEVAMEKLGIKSESTPALEMAASMA